MLDSFKSHPVLLLARLFGKEPHLQFKLRRLCIGSQGSGGGGPPTAGTTLSLHRLRKSTAKLRLDGVEGQPEER